MTRTCSRCKEVAEMTSLNYCRPCSREYKRAWAKKNPDKIARYMKQDRERHLERYAAQDKRQREVNGHSEYKRKTVLKGSFVEKVSKKAVYERDEATCGICKTHVPYSEYELDHVIPLSRGGLHEMSNTQVAHGTCNRRKHNKLPSEMQLVTANEGLWS